uniref:Putative ovule protein n=1 Tax=Solanum chacoense TaxID=4108 RepID=A0A0V0IPV4_SOLCH
MIRKWNTKEKLADLYCTSKFNVKGRYMSILSLQGNERLVLIIPELALNAGWNDIAFKIERFIKCSNLLINAEPFRAYKEDYPYARVVHESKWQYNTLKESTVAAGR